jgi:PAS domain S-box-containing protein
MGSADKALRRPVPLEPSHHLAAIVESSDDAIISKDLNGIITTWNKGAERLFGYTAEEAIGQSITILIPPDRHNEETRILARIRSGERVQHYETVRLRKDGTPVEISLSVSPVRNLAGEIVGASKIARDISERKETEARLKLLTRELDHRVKNILSTVMALTRRTQGDTIAEYSRALTGRFRALSHSHTLLSKSRWPGADIKDLVEVALSPFRGNSNGHVRVSGPSVVVAPDAAQALEMTLHELATNAAKYGALSVANGSVTVEWSVGDGFLVLRWTEAHGPAVSTPLRRGFGTRLIETCVKNQLKGELRVDWRTEGLACEIRAPETLCHRA